MTVLDSSFEMMSEHSSTELILWRSFVAWDKIVLIGMNRYDSFGLQLLYNWDNDVALEISFIFFATMFMSRAWRDLLSNQILSSKSKSFLGVWQNALQILSCIYPLDKPHPHLNYLPPSWINSRLQKNNPGQIVRIMYHSIYNCVQNCGNENACSENFVKSCSAVVIFNAFESNYTASTGLSSFLTTQTDQSKRDILTDYVLKPNFLCIHCKTSFTITPQQHI